MDDVSHSVARTCLKQQMNWDVAFKFITAIVTVSLAIYFILWGEI